ncbi:MAG: peptidase S41, partial [Bacteroidales bacterium]|nr:peptidase S41 [Bacteroidales bacterium]
EITALKKALSAEKARDLHHYRQEIQPLLEEEIACRYYLQEGRFKSMIRDDVQLQKALSVVENNK